MNDEEKFIVAEVGSLFKAAVSVMVSVISAAIIGSWIMISNINIEQVRQSAAIDKLQGNVTRDKEEINLRQLADESEIAVIKKQR